LDFTIKNLWSITINGFDMWITETIVNTWVVMAVLILIAIIFRFKLNTFKEIPKGLQNIIEFLIESFDSFMHGSASPKLRSLSGWFFTVFAFVLFSNLSGLFTLRPPTADFVTTFALALSTFILTHVMGIVHRKGKYLKSFLEPYPFFLPLNIIGELARPISLSFRLFGNILAGSILMSLIYALVPVFIRFGIPSVLHAYFDLFSGVLQTYIFCILSVTFISAASAGDEPA